MVRRLSIWHKFIFVVVGTCFFILVTFSKLNHGHAAPEQSSFTSHQSGVSFKELASLMREAEKDNTARLVQIKHVCSKYHLGIYKSTNEGSTIKYPPTPNYSVFYINREDRISWCPIYKAASSTWLYHFLKLGGFTEKDLAKRKDQLSTLARRIYPELEYPEAEEALQESSKFLVVRHPFYRLLSAYRDKLENINIGQEHGTVHFYKKYGRKIVEKYRQGGNSTSTKSLLDDGTYYWDPKRPQPAGVEPTFKEFVRYLINLDLANYADDHWMPYYLYCTPCLLQYTFVAKVETLQRDQLYIIHSTNLVDKISPTWQHRTPSSNKFTPDEILFKYFSQLSIEEIFKLYEKYKLDFEMFNYSIPQRLLSKD